MSDLVLCRIVTRFCPVKEQRKDLEDEPLAEADGFDCDVPADECEVGVTDREGKANEAEASLREEIFEAFKPVTSIMVESPVDGLPVPADERSDLAMAHPFTRETVVCVEDDTSYVELFAEELEERGFLAETPTVFVSDTSFSANIRVGARSQFDSETGKYVERRSFEPDEVLQRFGVLVAERDGETLAVRMKRERCKHFKRQVMANDDVPSPKEPGHLLRFYNCTIRKSVGGAFMTLRDEAVYACDYRSPGDPSTVEKYLDSFDRRRLNGKLHLELIRPFNLG